MWGVRRRVAGVSLGGVAVGLMSVLVVLAMVAAAVLSRQSADVHRRAQVLAGEVRASTQEMSALKWRSNSEVLAGTADLSSGGALVLDGARIISALNREIAELQRLQPGGDAERLQRDVQEVYVGGLKVLCARRGAKAFVARNAHDDADYFSAASGSHGQRCAAGR